MLYTKQEWQSEDSITDDHAMLTKKESYRPNY